MNARHMRYMLFTLRSKEKSQVFSSVSRSVPFATNLIVCIKIKQYIIENIYYFVTDGTLKHKISAIVQIDIQNMLFFPVRENLVNK